MGVSDTIRCLTDIVAEIEADGFDVSEMETETTDDGLDGTLTLDLELFPTRLADSTVSLELNGVEMDDDGTARFDVGLHVPDDTTFERLATPPSDEGRQAAYKDPEQLAVVYETYDSFPAMTEALGVDVTPKTVRNHMVKHGIHDPEENKVERDDSPGADRSADSEQDSSASDSETAGPPEELVLSDGLGLPEGVTLGAIKECVRSASTLREFRRPLGLDHATAMALLEELNLLDLVYGRVSTASEREISMEDIETRINATIENPA